jgi:hypothetical protein
MEGNRQINGHVADFASAVNLTARQAGSDHMTKLVQRVGEVFMRFAASSSSFRPSSITVGSPATISETIRDQGQAALDEMLEDARERIKYVNLLTDSGTVHRFNTLHAVLANPNFPEAVIPFDVQENLDFDAIHYEEFFKEQIATIRDAGIELVAIICDNCPAQVDGVGDSLFFFDDLGITHIPCFNRMVNLVFTHALKHLCAAPLVEEINECIQDLQTTPGREIMGRRCPTLVKTRWVYLVDVLHYFLLYRDLVKEVRAHFHRSPIPESFRSLYWIFLPLQLFSLSVAARSRKLYEIIPLIMEVVREFRDVAERLGSAPEKEILEFVVAHFFARLRINAFESAVTAWMMSYHGRQTLRSGEKRFHAPGKSEPPDLSKVRCVSEMSTQWSNRLEPGRVSDPRPEVSPETPAFEPPDFVDTNLLEDPPLPVQTPVARQRALFDRALHDQLKMRFDIRLASWLLPNPFQVALKEIRSKADELHFDADRVEATFRQWMFDIKVPTVHLDAAEDWREVHLRGAEWHGLSRIGLRYAAQAKPQSSAS